MSEIDEHNDTIEVDDVDEVQTANTRKGKYRQIIERVFTTHYREDADSLSFTRDDLIGAATELQLKAPSNIGDVVYTFRYRQPLPEEVRTKAPTGREWIIRGVGDARYSFVLVNEFKIAPNENYSEIKIPEATPGIIARYALNDEQALLAKVRYNRLIDIFTGVTCYSLQNHLRTKVAEIGQLETDEVYVGVDRDGKQYIFPVQAKGKNDKLGRIQVEQDLALCRNRFSQLICRPIGAQFMRNEAIALFELTEEGAEIKLVKERYYRLVHQDNITDEDLGKYRSYILVYR